MRKFQQKGLASIIANMVNMIIKILKKKKIATVE